MKKTGFVILLIISFMGKTTFSQEQSIKTNKAAKIPSIGLGSGLVAFKGDIGSRNSISDLNNFRIGYVLNIEKKIGTFSAVSLNFLYGKFSQTERLKYSNKNFQSPLIQADLNYVFNFDNDFIFKQDLEVTPYIFLGVGFLKFDPHTDLKDSKGNKYYYWFDGTIRDLPANDSTRFYAKRISRDYKYETQLKDPKDNYRRSTFTLPIGFGLKFKISKSLDVRLASTYYFTGSDRLDNIARNDNKDKLIFSQLSIDYHFGRVEKKDVPEAMGMDFSAIEAMDHDDDGVKDNDDHCQNTPKGIEIDGVGCPLDDDHDGVPNYLDKEVTPTGNFVDINGVTISDDKFEELFTDSISTDREKLFLENPELRNEADILRVSGNSDRSLNLPEQFRSADENKDGVISSNEISNAIDTYFQGDSGYSVEKLHKLIDFFFEQ